MTPQEKAAELYEKFIHQICEDNGLYINDSTDKSAKYCAIICVEEIIALRKGYFMCENKMQDEEYWQDVLTELNKL